MRLVIELDDGRDLGRAAGDQREVDALLRDAFLDDVGDYHDSDSFSGSELLRIAHLATRAYDRISELRQANRDAADNEGSAWRLAGPAL